MARFYTSELELGSDQSLRHLAYDHGIVRE